MAGNDDRSLSSNGRRDGGDKSAVGGVVFGARCGVLAAEFCHEGKGGLRGRLGAFDDRVVSGSSPLFFHPVSRAFDRVDGGARLACISKDSEG